MFDLRFVRSRVMLVLTLLAGLTAGSASWAQEGEQREPKDIPAPGQRVEIVEEAWAFGMDRAEAQAMLEARLTMEIERIERSCRITEGQKKQLQLAGRGDLKRFLDRVDEVRRSRPAPKGGPGQANAIQQEMEPLERQLRAGLHREGSMFAKTLKRALSDDQVSAYREGLRESRRFRHRARVDLVVGILDMAAGCTDEQRQRLTQLLLQETRLPSQADEDDIVVLAQAARLPEARIRPIFDDSQWRAVSPLLRDLAQGSKVQLDRAVCDPDDAAGPVATGPGPSGSGRK
jgi:hypothetical protein